jgi:hypothetical protein
MEILKSSLKQVPENERIKGRVYGVSDSINGQLEGVAIFSHGNTPMLGVHWNYWFELPESMLPVREVEVMPEEFELMQGEWEYYSKYDKDWICISKNTRMSTIKFRKVSTNPAQTVSIPAGTKAEQLEFLRGVIATLEGGGV